jgi:curved DNA-binding protein CbpA
VNEAYYCLSEPSRRSEYDQQRGYYRHPSASDPFTESDDPTGQSYSWAWDFFENQNGSTAPNGRQATEDAQFSDAFEEMMQDEGFSEGNTPNQQGGNPSTMWGMVGAVSGGALGFIVGNVPGLLAGAVAGNRLGAIRDTKGKSVYEVFRVRPDCFLSLSSFCGRTSASAVCYCFLRCF